MNAIKEWFLNQPMTETQKNYRMGMPLPLMVFWIFIEIFFLLIPYLIFFHWALEDFPVLAALVIFWVICSRVLHHIGVFVTRAHYLKLDREVIHV